MTEVPVTMGRIMERLDEILREVDFSVNDDASEFEEAG